MATVNIINTIGQFSVKGAYENSFVRTAIYIS